MVAPPSIRLAPDALQALQDASVADYPLETCGILLGRSVGVGRFDVSRVESVPNAAPIEDRPRRYAIEPRLLLHWERAAQAAGQSIVGFFHSHPDHPAVPSATDADLAWPAYAYVIVSVAGRATKVPLVSGLAAWTFDEPSSSFRELAIELAIEAHEIEYYI